MTHYDIKIDELKICYVADIENSISNPSANKRLMMVLLPEPDGAEKIISFGL